MSAYRSCVELGEYGVGIVERYLLSRGRIFENRIVRTDKGRLSMMLQATVGDLVANVSNDYIVQSFEVKTERRWSPNLFLETDSNATEERYKEGWLHTLDADWLVYYFVEADKLYFLDFPRLKEWAFCGRRRDGTAGAIFDYPLKAQRANAQLNVTKGRCVPIADLRRAGLIKREASPLANLGPAA